MDFSQAVTRRSFLKVLAGGVGVTLTVHSLPTLALANNVVQPKPVPLPGNAAAPAWGPVAGKARWRIDGMRKVLGQKIYARDFTAKDFPDWPQQGENWLFALRCARSDKAVLGYDISMLPDNLKPVGVIDALALAAKKMPPKASNMTSPFFTSIGSPPDFYGQPVAILIFADFNTYRRAVKILQFNPDVIKFGAEMPKFSTAFTPGTHYVRDDRKNFSYYGTPNGDYTCQQYAVDAEVRKAIEGGSWQKFTRSFYTQTIDPMFMEPEAGLAWYNAKADGGPVLNLVLGTQSPTGDIEDCASAYSGSPSAPASIDMYACYPGGGFGGRDTSYFSMYLAMAAVFANGPIRWALNRFEQFQIGLKRGETEFSETVALDADGKIQGLLCNFIVNSGGEKNLSPYVAQLAGMSSMSCYEIPLAVAAGAAVQTRQLIGGSQRGFGGPQAFMAIETLLDEAAVQLKIDPFALRRKNLLGGEQSKGKGKTITGAPVLQDLQLTAMLDILEKHPLWRGRLAQQQAKQKAGLKYGVGFAMSNQAYGTSMDGMFGAVQIEDNGSITVHTPYVDMGNGAATALGLAAARGMGKNASFINMGEAALFNSLGLILPPRGPSTSACTNTGSTLPDPIPPNMVLKASGSSSACLGAFQQYHVVENAGVALMLQSVLPAARALWGNSVAYDAVKWVDGKLTTAGAAPLDFAALLGKIKSMGLPTYCAAHATFCMFYATADFPFASGSHNLPLDYIALGTTDKNLTMLLRSNLKQPPQNASRSGRSVYAPCCALVATTVNPKSGEIKIDEVVSVLSAGVQHCPEIVSGQSQGGIAMAIGNVLLEDCPIGLDGPGNGTWNLNRYKVARMSDIPKQELIVLPPAEGETTARGIAEAVFCPIGPAILNALAMALNGKRFTSTPVTPKNVLEALK